MKMSDATKLITEYKKRKKAAVAGSEKRIYVYDLPPDDADRKVLGRVRVNNDLDIEKDGEFFNPAPGAHKGIGKYMNGRFAFVFFHEDKRERDWALATNEKSVAEEIIKTGNTYLFLDKKYKGLNDLIEYGFRRELLPPDLRREVAKGLRERVGRTAARKRR